MHKPLLLFSLLIIIVLAGCEKEIISNASGTKVSAEQSAHDNTTANAVVSTNHWYGSYTNFYPYDPNKPGDPDLYLVQDYDFINNGVAELPIISAGYNFDYSNFSFDIPSQYNISGDSLTFVAVVKNPRDGNFYDDDVVLQLVGDLQSATVHFVADTAALQATQYYVGNAGYTGIASLVNYFGDFKTIKLVLKKNQTSTYVDNQLAYRFMYGAVNRIGRLQTITVSGKGYAIVNSVKLLNSFTNKTILTENFNTNGQSHTVFY